MSKDENPTETLKSATESNGLDQSGAAETAAKPPLSPAAKRALAEAEARRQAHEMEARAAEKEVGGRGGADPARFGDWEINGRAIDF